MADAGNKRSSPPLVSGVVRDARGKPLPGLEVWSHPEPPKSDFGKTDAEGRFELAHTRDPQVVVVVDPVHHLAASRQLETGVTHLDLRLAPALAMTGRVEDPQGRPIPKAQVQVSLQINRESGNWTAPLYWQPIATDAQGGFKIVNVPADRTYALHFNAQGYGAAQQEVATQENRLVELSPVVLKKADRMLTGQVVDGAGTPLAKAMIQVSGNGQPELQAQSDSHGRFALQVCEGKVYFTAWREGLQTFVTAPGGSTDVVVVLKPQPGRLEREKPERASLLGKPLPALAGLNLPGDAVAPRQPLLLCLFDCEQRPSRQLLRLLAEQCDSWQQRGMAVLGIQTVLIGDESFRQWQKSNTLPFTIGRLTQTTAASAWATEVDSLPYLILVNSRGRVVAAGVSLEELPGKLDHLGE